MADDKGILENRMLRMKSPLDTTKAFIRAARVVEGLSKITETTVDFYSKDRALSLDELVGQDVTVEIAKDNDYKDVRKFVGTCIEAYYVGYEHGYAYYSAQLRSWNWFLTKGYGNRIFQNKTVVQIIEDIFNELGFSDYDVDTSHSYVAREYTVQYNESNWDFLCRLMEEEGLYFFSTVKGTADHLMIVDNIGPHKVVPDFAKIEYKEREGQLSLKDQVVFEWRSSERVTSGRVTLNDWNFEKTTAPLKVVKAMPEGKHSHKNHEIYRYPGHYRETSLGDHYVKVEMEANAVQYQTRTGICNVRVIGTGATFSLTDHKRSSENAEYMVSSAIHMMQIELEEDNTQGIEDVRSMPGSIEIAEENKDMYRCTFSVIPKQTQFRAPRTTSWPRIPGILIATVTGPAGEEIHTDKYGRIKVQFPWDREGKKDEKTTCWVRVVTPWSGNKWGMVNIPRIKQEVVIQFEDGDPDRPICTGMLYNAETMPPYDLPANKMQSGFKSNSSKGGGGFNELLFEDKKDAEFVHLQSEKDYQEIIKNNAVITIGMEKMDPGDLTQTIYANKTETIKTGDMTFTIETGSEHRDIKTDKNEKIGGNSDLKVTGNVTEAVTGNQEAKITGNLTEKVTGNREEKTTGTYTSKTTGAVTIESSQKIVLKVGGNSITIDQSGIKIKGMMVETNASGMATHKAGGIMTIKGSLTMIN
jgi:type VI secretion system secreted protein VgrG